MITFAIAEGSCGSGPARYEDGFLTLPDGVAYGIEALIRIEVETNDDAPSLQRTTGTLTASLRDTLGHRGSGSPLPFPWRFAVSTMRAGLGVIEEGLRTSADLTVRLTFSDEATVTASMPRDLADLIRRDAALVRAAFERTGQRPSAPPVEAPKEPEAVPDPSTEAALTSIFRYEKRNGRLRRVPIDDPET